MTDRYNRRCANPRCSDFVAHVNLLPICVSCRAAGNLGVLLGMVLSAVVYGILTLRGVL